MINIALSKGDIQGDMVPHANTHHKSPGQIPSVGLKPGNSLYSPGGAFRLTLQTDGNAVLQRIDDSTLQWNSGQPLDPTQIRWIPVWSTGTNNRAVTELDMQADGNFVVYAGTTPVFSSQTDQNNLSNGAFLRMQDDGNLVIYIGNTAIWNTGTYARAGG